MKKLIKSRHFWFYFCVFNFFISLTLDFFGFEFLGQIFFYLCFTAFFMAYFFMAKFVWNGNKLAVKEIKIIMKKNPTKENDSTGEQIKK